jgi:hypothetical protein
MMNDEALPFTLVPPIVGTPMTDEQLERRMKLIANAKPIQMVANAMETRAMLIEIKRLRKAVKPQSKIHSLAEAMSNNVVSFGVAFFINAALMTMLVQHFDKWTAALVQTLTFTAVSVGRTYCMRRFFNWLHHQHNHEYR